jgi:flavin-dependent dehydrogenase
MRHNDVVIIGGGLAGLQCARLLAASNARVLLIDRKADLTKGVHTTGIFVRKTFEDFDFPAGALGRPIRNVKLYSPRLRVLDLESKSDEFRVGKMGLLYQSMLKECLDLGVRFYPSTRFISIKKHAGRSTVTLERNGKRFDIETKVVVGADGASSSAAKVLGLEQNRECIVGYEEVFHTQKFDRKPELHCFLDSKLAPGYLAWVTDDGEEVHLGVGGYSASFAPREALREFKSKIAANFPQYDLAEPNETRGGRIPVGGVLREISNKHGLLIGDAAGAVSPLTAGGLDPCLRLSSYAARLIIERLRTDDPATLLQYSGREFRARFVSRLWMRRAISMLGSQTLLELGCWFLRGRLGRSFAKHVFFGRGSFPDVPHYSTSPRIEVLDQ